MSYEKQNFEDNQVLEASDLNHIEDGIVDNERAIEKKQDKLVSGSNIKTINNQSLIGSGNISINPDLSGYATKEFVQSEIEQAQLENKEIDLSGYATKTELNNKADKTELNIYATKSELNNKANKTELNIYATKSELNNKANRTELNSYATKEFVQSEIEQAQLEDKEIDLSSYQSKNDNGLQTSNKTIVGAINEIDTKSLTAIDYTDGTDIIIEDVSNVDLSNYQQKTDNNLQTSSKNLVGAINELFQSANNGKELIANAIGEPLNSEDTFSAMSNDINSLLNTFKTNMMKNGITVESGDKFKTLIDKIATMVEEGSGKGIQIIQGSLETSDLITKTYAYRIDETGNGGTTPWLCFDASVLGFSPSIILINFLYSTNTVYDAIYDNMIKKEYYLRAYDKSKTQTSAYTGMKVPDVINTASLILPLIQEEQLKWGIKNIQYIAIGVGEEDTTLRDSLADILENKGVDVTEEDDMADLITKVDNLLNANGNIEQEIRDIINSKGYVENKDLYLIASHISDADVTIDSDNNFYKEDGGLRVHPDYEKYTVMSFNEEINFSNYDKILFTGYSYQDFTPQQTLYIAKTTSCFSANTYSNSKISEYTTVKINYDTTGKTVYEVDITSWSGTGYLTFELKPYNSSDNSSNGIVINTLRLATNNKQNLTNETFDEMKPILNNMIIQPKLISGTNHTLDNVRRNILSSGTSNYTYTHKAPAGTILLTTTVEQYSSTTNLTVTHIRDGVELNSTRFTDSDETYYKNYDVQTGDQITFKAVIGTAVSDRIDIIRLSTDVLWY